MFWEVEFLGERLNHWRKTFFLSICFRDSSTCNSPPFIYWYFCRIFRPTCPMKSCPLIKFQSQTVTWTNCSSSLASISSSIVSFQCGKRVRFMICMQSAQSRHQTGDGLCWRQHTAPQFSLSCPCTLHKHMGLLGRLSLWRQVPWRRKHELG